MLAAESLPLRQFTTDLNAVRDISVKKKSKTRIGSEEMT